MCMCACVLITMLRVCRDVSSCHTTVSYPPKYLLPCLLAYVYCECIMSMFDPYEIHMRKNQRYIRTYFVGRMFKASTRIQRSSSLYQYEEKMINNKNKSKAENLQQERNTRGFSRKLYAACVIYF
jgi:hypothetical protein